MKQVGFYHEPTTDGRIGPSVKIMLNSPAAQTLRPIARQFPLLRAPSIVDNNPRMRPWHDDWNRWLDADRR